MFLNLQEKRADSIAVIEQNGSSITYKELCDFSNDFSSRIISRTLVFILSENSIGSLAGFVASLSGKIVPLIISNTIDPHLLGRLIDIYKPAFFWVPDKISTSFKYQLVYQAYGYSMLSTEYPPCSLHPDLSMLLPTSGSTGSPKLVRHSYVNIEANAQNVASFFKLGTSDRPIAILPMHFTMGLSVITSHLFAGSTILLSEGSLTDRSFWQFVKEQKATSFTGVPYSFEILYKLRFSRMDLPYLTLLSQGGGKMSDELFKFFADYANETGRRFIATYGQTEGSARMAYLPAHLAIKKTGSIGNAIPGGKLSLVDEEGQKIAKMESTGEMLYEGPNVTMGYAYSGEDLCKGDDNMGELKTGDIARRDSDGYYYIIGRVSRFLKIYGIRISMDEIEHLVESTFETDCLCSGNDLKMKIYITNNNQYEKIRDYILHVTGLFHEAVEIVAVEEIPKNESGKRIFTN